MTSLLPEHPEFLELLGALREGRITPEQFTRLDRWLADDPALQQCYVEYMLLCAELRRYHGSPKPVAASEDGPGSAVSVETPAEPSGSPRHPIDALLDEIIEQDKQAAHRLSAEEARHRSETRKEMIREVAEAALEQFKEQERIRQEELAYRQYLARRRRLLVGGCAVTILLFLAVFPWISGSHLRPAAPRVPVVPAPPVVARIAQSSNAQWLDPDLSTLRETPLTPSSLCLTQGLVQLAYDGGTTVLLQAPASVRLETAERLFLRGGTVSVRIGEDSTGFIVRTPTGTVVDYGTEFGVLVNRQGETEAIVYEGKAGLRSGSDPVRAVTSMILTEGQAGVVDAGGRLAPAPFEHGRIVRSIPSMPGFGIPGRRLDLADVVAGGNGFGTGLPRVAIDPATGQQVAPREQDRTGPGQYALVPWNRYVDGVFVPDGRMRQTVSSEGHSFVECPPTNNIFYLEITNTEEAGVGLQILSGGAYGTRNRPCILMHANLGVTFDLMAIRQAVPGARIDRFCSGFGVSESGTSRPCHADFWVLVDGQVRFRRIGVREKGRIGEIGIELKDHERFLTLVTTDGGDEDTTLPSGRATDSDWCVFAEPVIELVTISESPKLVHESRVMP